MIAKDGSIRVRDKDLAKSILKKDDLVFFTALLQSITRNRHSSEKKCSGSLEIPSLSDSTHGDPRTCAVQKKSVDVTFCLNKAFIYLGFFSRSLVSLALTVVHTAGPFSSRRNELCPRSCTGRFVCECVASYLQLQQPSRPRGH